MGDLDEARLISLSDSVNTEAIVKRIRDATSGIDEIVFRTPDNTQERALPAARPLFRWDDSHPSTVFEFGFKAPVPIADDTSPHTAYSLRTHIDASHRADSGFVATVQLYQSDGQSVCWQPRVQEGVRLFEYEILGHGGIDINATLGDANPRYDLHQVAFPGSIRREFIRAAREWYGSQLRRVWDNPYFDNTASGDGLSPPLKRLPAPIRPPGVEVVFFPTQDDSPPVVRVPNVDVMDEPGAPGVLGSPLPVDSTRIPTPGPPSPPPPYGFVDRGHTSTASFLDPWDNKGAYFFCANRFVPVHNPRSPPSDFQRSKTIIGNWPSLVETGRGNLDAVLPDPTDKHLLYIFWDTLCATIQIKGDQNRREDVVRTATKDIVTQWTSLKEGNFDRIDAVLPCTEHDHGDEAYVFSGENYIRIKSKTEKNSNDELLDHPKPIVDGWPALKRAGFKFVDTALLRPDDHSQAYFFCGDYYVLTRSEPGSAEIIERNLISDGWPSLVKAGFW